MSSETTDVEADSDELPGLHIGDHVQDREDDDATMLVIGLPPQRAAAYVVDEETGATVSDYNKEYDETALVVEVTYPQRTDSVAFEGQQRYAFPRARLELVTPIHDRDETEAEE